MCIVYKLYICYQLLEFFHYVHEQTSITIGLGSKRAAFENFDWFLQLQTQKQHKAFTGINLYSRKFILIIKINLHIEINSLYDFNSYNQPWHMGR